MLEMSVLYSGYFASFFFQLYVVLFNLYDFSIDFHPWSRIL